jgi:hypothetical protein
MIDTTWPALIQNSRAIDANEPSSTCPRIYPLTDTCIVEVSGDGAEKLLQGQLTCDVRTLNDQQGAFGAICTPQGRMFSLFRIVRSEGVFLLKMSQSTVEPFLQRIEKYRQFFKADIQVKSDKVCFGLHIPDACNANNDSLNAWINTLPKGANHQRTQQNTTVFRLPTLANYWEIWTDKNSWINDSSGLPLRELLTDTQPQAELTETNEWNIQLALGGIPELAEKSVDQLVPHMVNLHKIGGVSFKKGCYTGQEIVARMEYLGKLKKQVYCYQASHERCLGAETTIHDQEGANLGSFISSFKNQLGVAGLALLPKSLEDNFENNTYQLESVIDGESISLALSLPRYLSV